MRVLIDTNILISAALSPRGTPYKAFFKAVTYHFLSIALLVLEVVPTPIDEIEKESLIRDVADRPILRAALHAKSSFPQNNFKNISLQKTLGKA